MSLRFTKAVQLMHRPQLITAQAAEVYARRLIELDPRAFGRRTGFAAIARKLGLERKRPAAWHDDDDGPAEPAPTTPAAYAPLWMGEPDKQLDWGWSIKDGIALMEIAGPLVEKGGYVGECWEWMHGYDTIAAAIAEADADTSVDGMLIRFDTPGGVVASGIYDLAKDLQARPSNAKPIWAICEMACSAGYWIASQLDNVLAPAAGQVGSIGVVIVHENYAEALKQVGIEITSIEFPEGGFKTDGAWWKSLSEPGKAALQSDINELGAAFLSTVEAGRGEKLTAEKARALGAQVFMAVHSDKSRDAKALGLIDGVMSEREAFEALRAEVNATAAFNIPAPAGTAAAPAASKPATSGPSMETDMKRASVLAVLAGTTSAKTDSEKLEEIRKIANEEDEEKKDDAGDGGEDGEGDKKKEEEEPVAAAQVKPAAKVDALGRAQAILALPEAKGREQLAHDLAFEPAFAGVSVEQAKATLGKSAKASALADRVTDPKLQADGGEDTRSEAKRDSDRALANAGIRIPA